MEHEPDYYWGTQGSNSTPINKKKSDTQACHSECLHNGIILIVYILQFVVAKVILFCDIDKYFYDRLCFFRKLPASFGTTIGDLWEICGLSVAFYKRISIIMLQKSSARKGFCAEGWRIWRVKWYIYTTRGKCRIYKASRVGVFF